jgi:hypothetical protein
MQTPAQTQAGILIPHLTPLLTQTQMQTRSHRSLGSSTKSYFPPFQGRIVDFVQHNIFRQMILRQT